MTGEDSQQSKLEAYRQHCEQMRHNQYQRLTFTNFYAIVVVGILAFVSQSEKSDYTILFWVLSVLSLFGVAFCLRMYYAIEYHNKKARQLVKELTGESEEALGKYLPFSSGWIKWRNIWSLRWLFIYLYVVAFVFFVLLASKIFSF